MIATKWIFTAIGVMSMGAGIYKGSGLAFGYGVLLLLIAIVEAYDDPNQPNKGGFGA
jgi:hypothetical protein